MGLQRSMLLLLNGSATQFILSENCKEFSLNSHFPPQSVITVSPQILFIFQNAILRPQHSEIKTPENYLFHKNNKVTSKNCENQLVQNSRINQGFSTMQFIQENS